jgi:excisionase family DNA binding protein
MSTMMADEDLWDVARAAQFLGMSVSWTYRAAESGVLPYRRIGSRLRFVPSELRAWVSTRADQRIGE